MKPPITIRAAKRPSPLALTAFPEGRVSYVNVELFEDGLGSPLEVPFIIVRGKKPGPTLGLSAAVHGDELNGIGIIHEVVDAISPEDLCGNIICAPIVNVPAYKAGQRRFSDGSDLNHAFPGKRSGRTSQQYAWRFLRVFLPPLDALIDIHTASEGRVNTFYVRADLTDPQVRAMALAMNPEILLHVRGGDATLRGSARARKIPAITVEAGNPSTFQESMVLRGATGVLNICRELALLKDAPSPPNDIVICSESSWIYTTTGGVLDCRFGLGERLEEGQLIARTRDPFGRVTERYNAPYNGIVIGMAQDPVAVPGTRYCHLGRIGDPLK